MKNLTGGATKPRRSAFWVNERYHAVVGLCARVLKITAGEFVERAVDRFVAKLEEQKK